LAGGLGKRDRDGGVADRVDNEPRNTT
jgi:hypothetical protein